MTTLSKNERNIQKVLRLFVNQLIYSRSLKKNSLAVTIMKEEEYYITHVVHQDNILLTIKRLLALETPTFRATFASRPHYPREIRWLFAKDSSILPRIEVARNDNTDLETLCHLYDDPSESVREAVKGHFQFRRVELEIEFINRHKETTG